MRWISCGSLDLATTSLSTIVTQKQYDKILKIKHVTSYNPYGIASDTNYYYREDIDYKFDVYIQIIDTAGGPKEVRSLQLNKINKDMYLKSYHGFIEQGQLKEGKLPESLFEVVAGKDYSVGDTITVYLDNYALMGANELKLDFSVSGVLNDSSEDLYFSDIFMTQMDFIGKIAYENAFLFYISYYGNRYNERKSAKFAFIPLFLDSGLEDNIIVFSRGSLNNMGGEIPLRMRSAGILENKYTEAIVTDYLRDKVNDEIGGNFIEVSENIYHQYIDSYDVLYARIYVDEYPYVNDVIKELKALGFDVMSPFRANSATLDEDKMLVRSITLIVAIIALAIIYWIYYLYFIIVERRKNKEEGIMLRQGASSKILNKLNNYDILFSTLISAILTFFVFLIVKTNISYLNEAYKYIRYYHILIFYALLITLTIFIMFRNNNKLNKKINKEAK